MAAGPASHCWILFLGFVFVSAGDTRLGGLNICRCNPDVRETDKCQKEVKVRRGEAATLECYGPSDATDILLRWTKPDLQTDDYVIYFKDGRFEKHNQNDLFKGRVEMKDSKWMKNGNFSVILQNVTMKDSGTYECEAAYNNQKPRPLNSTRLKVEERGQTGGQSGDGGEEAGGKESGSVGLTVGLSVPAVLVIVGVGAGAVFIYRTYRRRQNQDYQPPEDQGL